MQKSSRKDVVAHQHRHLIIKGGIDRGLSTTFSTLIHHIIMHQRGGMQQLQAYCSIQRHVTHLAIVLRYQQRQQWAHPLAATLTDMCQGVA